MDEPAPPSRPRVCLLIATAPRSGSWLLAESLRALEIAGRPEEYLRVDLEEEYRGLWAVPPTSGYDAVLEAMLRAGQTPNGVFGVKLHWFQFVRLLHQLGQLERSLPGEPRRGLALLQAHLGPVRWIYLERRDSARQAVSWYRALVSNQWWRVPGQQRATATVPFDFEAIKTLHHLLLDYRAAWRTWLREEDADVLGVYYEDLAARPAATLRRVLAHAGVPAPRTLPRPTLVRQADATSEWLVDAYRRSYVATFGVRAWPEPAVPGPVLVRSRATTRPVS